ncbi:hypothetical protein C9374_001307 [Naegleria lovaniensis]|uniref:Uncharacterized protein n=1 Tax=Naegleria lovaniensis TaxID=51637 RepID=A0AA88KML6_NAELO|nr:uncharacterized protein C9374_001307 [Naegleria lovaniensis]KAG2387713.1 hypothetical protein C9374_001307 [Naegleria lovaniensis]
MNIVFPKIVSSTAVMSGLLNSNTTDQSISSNEGIRRIVGSEREMFDKINPETLQVEKYNVLSDRSIYSKRPNHNNRFQKDHDDLMDLEWRRNRELEQDVQKKESFKKRMTEITGKENKKINEPAQKAPPSNNKNQTGLLDTYLVKTDETENIPTTRRVKASTISGISNATNVTQLYSTLLPELRNELRRKGLRQVGFIRFNTNTITSDDALTKLRQSTKDTHNPFNPMAFEDPSLRILAPKQWQGTLPTPAKDDIIQSAITGLQTHFSLSSNFIKQGETIEYNFSVTRQHQDHSAHGPQSNLALRSISLQLVTSLSQVEKSRTLLQTKKTFQFEEFTQNEQNMIFTQQQPLNIQTTSLEPGTYQLFAQVLLFLPNSATSTILSSHGPYEVYIIPKD